MTNGKTYNKPPRRINHKVTKSKTNTGTTTPERSLEQTIGGGWFKAPLQPANPTPSPNATPNTETHKNPVRTKAPNPVNAPKRKDKNQINYHNKQRRLLMANPTVCQSKWKPTAEPRRAKPKTYRQAPIHRLKFYEEAAIESEARTAVVQLKSEAQPPTTTGLTARLAVCRITSRPQPIPPQRLTSTPPPPPRIAPKSQTYLQFF